MNERIRPSLDKVKVPRHRIPPAVLLCSRCESGTKVRTSSPFADGYHRRHDCLNKACGFYFYSLAAYGGGKVQVSPMPFKDRDLSPIETAERHRWQQEEATTNAPVTLQVIDPADRFAEPIVKRINDALFRAEALRTDADHLIVAVIQSLKDELETMDG